jgi:hypothetical protein
MDILLSNTMLKGYVIDLNSHHLKHSVSSTFLKAAWGRAGISRFNHGLLKLLGTVSKDKQKKEKGIKRTRERKKHGEGRAVHRSSGAHYTGELSGERASACSFPL